MKSLGNSSLTSNWQLCTYESVFPKKNTTFTEAGMLVRYLLEHFFIMCGISLSDFEIRGQVQAYTSFPVFLELFLSMRETLQRINEPNPIFELGSLIFSSAVS